MSMKQKGDSYNFMNDRQSCSKEGVDTDILYHNSLEANKDT